MKQDIILSGVGGQGILSIAYVIDNAALKDGVDFKQAEVHGMSQRGGAVQSHLRLSDEPIFSDLIPKGMADMILSVEPMEALRYLDYLQPEGYIVTSSTPFVNVPDYPDLEDMLKHIRGMDRTVVIDSKQLAQEAGSIRAQNMVMLGAASHRLVLRESSLLEFIRGLFEAKGKEMVDLNLDAFRRGREAAAGSL